MSTQRIRLSDGKYCYSGPTCKWHSPTGIHNVRRELRAAGDDLHNATTLEELTAAKDRHAAAQKMYDATDEGLELLRKELREENAKNVVSVDKHHIFARIKAAEELAGETERKQQELMEPKNSGGLVLNDDHTYDVPTFAVHGEDITSPTVGSKYKGFQDVAVIAKDVRADLKEAKAKGYLPDNLKYAVEIDKYSGGQSLTVTVQGLDDKDLAAYNTVYGRNEPSPQSQELKKRVNNIAAAYNSSVIRGEIDYFSSMYNPRVVLEEQSQREYRLEASALAKKKRQVAAKKKEIVSLKAGKDSASFIKESGAKMIHSTKDGRKFGRIDGTDFFVIEKPSRIDSNKTVATLYDLTGIKTTDGTSIEETFSTMDSARIETRFKKNRFAK